MGKSPESGESISPRQNILLRPVRETANFVSEHLVTSGYLALWAVASANTVATIFGMNIEASKTLNQMGIALSDPMYESMRTEVLSRIVDSRSPLFDASVAVAISSLIAGGFRT